MPKRGAATERARRAEREAALRRHADRVQRRRRLIAIGAVVVALLFVVGFVVAAANSGSTDSASSTTTTSPGQTSTSATDGPTVSVPTASGGAALTGATPCPAEDGSSPRTTSFHGPPPTCVDPKTTYDAVMTTSVGSFTFLLNSQLAPTAVNNFVVLARYHYWDGTTISSIITDTSFQGGAVTNAGGQPGPGYSLPAEYQHSGQSVGVIITPGTLAMAPVSPDSTSYGGEFLVALGDKATNLPPTTTVLGIMLDDPGNTLGKMNKLGTQAGGPTQVVTVRSVKIVKAPVKS
jgi:cyclophilin family peptidyl-prolyl cis-trans isomerase